ncbi:MAG: phosphopantetheine-binding protein [Nitrospirae bacterium YQR-1]
MISRKEIEKKVKEVLINEFELDEAALTSEANLYTDLELDSLDSVNLVAALEKAFSFKFSREKDEEKVRAIRTVSDIYDFIDSKQREG